MLQFTTKQSKATPNMSIEIDPTSIVHPKAQLGQHVKIGPYCTISSGAVIGDNTSLQSHVVVDGNTHIGANCKIFPFSCIGIQSQDLKFKKGNICYTSVGDHCIIREQVTIHAGTEDGSKTTIGNNCSLLAVSHVAHNCKLGNNVILSHAAILGGHVFIEDNANVGAQSAIHQFVRIGRFALVAGVARLTQDVAPYTIAEGSPGIMRVVNNVGLKRAGFSPEKIAEINKAFKILFKRGHRLAQAMSILEQEFPDSDVIQNMISFIQTSERGLARPTAD